MEAQSLHRVLRSIRGRLHHRQDHNPILDFVAELLAVADEEMARLQAQMNPKKAPAEFLAPRAKGLAGMNKAELWSIALRRFGERIDVNMPKEQMVAWLEEKIDQEVRPLEREIEQRLRTDFGWRPEPGRTYTVDELMTLEVDYENRILLPVREAVAEDVL